LSSKERRGVVYSTYVRFSLASLRNKTAEFLSIFLHYQKMNQEQEIMRRRRKRK
jgi:hypothetical protein